MVWFIFRASGLLGLRLSIAKPWLPDLSSWLREGRTSIFSPKATPAHLIFGLSIFVLAITAAIFLATGGVLAIRPHPLSPARYRSAINEPPQIYGSNQIELSWTVIPMIIVVILFLTTARVIFGTEYAAKPDARWMSSSSAISSGGNFGIRSSAS